MASGHVRCSDVSPVFRIFSCVQAVQVALKSAFVKSAWWKTAGVRK